MTDTCDALVLGGGPAGATTALLLAQAGWSVVVLERKAFPRRKVCGEYLSATNWPLFEALGLADAVRRQAGPEVRRVGLFAGDAEVAVDLPRPAGHDTPWGRALGREHLDTLWLDRAAQAGAEVRQPWEARELLDDGGQFICRAVSAETNDSRAWRAPVVVAAHGSWDVGPLPTQATRHPSKPGDLLGFKAHFRHTSLPSDLMPLLSFPGGYGGMVHCDDGRVSLSCCLRRDHVERLDRSAGASAGQAVLGHIMANNAAVRRVLSDAETEGRWLSAGPIRPGIRARYARGVYRIGNAAGEAHPAVAEGITMAMQSGWLLAERLIASRQRIGDRAERDRIGAEYSAAWRRSFAPRIQAASIVAQWAMRPAAVRVCLPLLRCFPGLLAWGARHSGKTELVVPPAAVLSPAPLGERA